MNCWRTVALVDPQQPLGSRVNIATITSHRGWGVPTKDPEPLSKKPHLSPLRYTPSAQHKHLWVLHVYAQYGCPT